MKLKILTLGPRQATFSHFSSDCYEQTWVFCRKHPNPLQTLCSKGNRVSIAAFKQPSSQLPLDRPIPLGIKGKGSIPGCISIFVTLQHSQDVQRPPAPLEEPWPVLWLQAQIHIRLPFCCSSTNLRRELHTERWPQKQYEDLPHTLKQHCLEYFYLEKKKTGVSEGTGNKAHGAVARSREKTGSPCCWAERRLTLPIPESLTLKVVLFHLLAVLEAAIINRFAILTHQQEPGLELKRKELVYVGISGQRGVTVIT